MPPKRRIHVAFDDDNSHGDKKRQRKFIVSVDADATIEQLATEISTSVDQAEYKLKLELAGFELRRKDSIAIIQDGELVVATSKDLTAPGSVIKPKPQLNKSHIAHPDEPGRMQIRLVTADLARKFAKENPKQQIEPTNGILAFDGELISGNVTFGVLQDEVARVCGWDVSMDLDDHTFHHEKEGACSCAVAQEIERVGLFSTLHCRFTIDGARCMNDDCPYSHAELKVPYTATAPHCIACNDALGFPCPKCLNIASASQTDFSMVVYCPLVQNAGCGHLHHAHCLGAWNENSGAGCPSGCQADKFPREDAIFDFPKSHITIVWDGDKTHQIPIPRSSPEGSAVHLTTAEVISLVESFLESNNFMASGQCLRIHSRDPATETVRFFQSTLVSVCPVSTHENQSHRRFNLFSEKAPVQFISPKGESEVDLHTALSPIITCRCTPLKDIFPQPGDAFANRLPVQVLLYAVERRNEMVTGSQASRPKTKSKEHAYLADSAWQPSVLQTPRGMAALLSSLYLFVHSAHQKGSNGEANILAFLYTITRFPPAVRALAVLLRNRIPLAQERAALSAALYHAATDFVVRAPIQVARNPSRFFEAIRILLAHILSAADEPPTSDSVMLPVIEEIPLVCSISQKPLTDPLLMDSAVVERSIALLRQPRGLLYKPSTTQFPPFTRELEVESLVVLKQILSHCRSLPSTSILALHVERISLAPPSHPYALDSVARDFLVAIRRANKTDLATRGPLELKSPSVVAPQIVLDEDGLLAVFTGRGCGSIRDATFFRPTNGGDTEVDVNDIAHSVDKVIPTRQAEDTWQLDSFSGDSVVSNRPPDEAIVLCLDLSESMNQVSAIADSRFPALKENRFDYEAESLKAVEEIVKDVSKDEILVKAKAYLEKQHFSCHHAWKTFLQAKGVMFDDDSESSGMGSNNKYSIIALLKDLGTIARRDVSKISMDESQPFHMKGLMNERAFFVAATLHQLDTLVDYLQGFLNSFVLSDVVGHEPYDVPRNLIDPKTGNLLTAPVCPENAPDDNTYFVNVDSCDWFEGKDVWPSGPFEPSSMTLEEIQEAVDEWIEGADLHPRMKPKTGEGLDGDDIIITLSHAGSGDGMTWNLSTTTTIRTLYALVHRATRARYSYFTIRLSSTKVAITDSANLTLGVTDLVDGGIIEISRTAEHTRGFYEVGVESYTGYELAILLPPGASTLSVISYIHASCIHNMCMILLWHGLKDIGDGVQHGTMVESYSNMGNFSGWGNPAPVSFECHRWSWHSSGAQKQREHSRHLTRLHLLKELFNIFLNRASSFDNSISLALGLVTFSDKARVDQEITPIFENFRQQLDRISATGDTAVYDALDTARAMLCSYWRDIPNLRKRIIIVSDGVDTCSKNSASEVCHALQKSGIIVDSVQVGRESDGTLHAISVATGGYRFSPKTSLSDALSIFDLETMLSSAERIARPAIPPILSLTHLLRYGDRWTYPVDVVTVDQFPPRARHAKLQARVRPVSFLLGGGTDNDDRTKRIMRELRTSMADPHPQVDLYVNESDISFFKIVLEAPKDGSPYQGGTFLLTCDLPGGYPRDPPEIRFVTFILHPNVSKQGKVCIAELGRLWASDITLKEIFSLIYGLLLEPDLDNPLEIQASLKYYDDDGTYALAVADAVTKHASKTRREWQLELSES